LAVLLLLTSAAHAEAPAFTPAEWQPRQGRWRFEGKELLCEGKGYSSLIYRRGLKARDLELAVEVKFSGPNASAGIFFRAQGARFYRDTTFYQFEWYTQGRHHGTRLSLMRKTPRWKQIVKPIFRAPPIGRWIKLRVHVVGDRITCFVDDKQVFSRRDKTFLRTGAMGLHVFQPQAVRFRRPVVRSLDGGG
jgi:hypothetical protein